jgi:hypothetical protein
MANRTRDLPACSIVPQKLRYRVRLRYFIKAVIMFYQEVAIVRIILENYMSLTFPTPVTSLTPIRRSSAGGTGGGALWIAALNPVPESSSPEE